VSCWETMEPSLTTASFDLTAAELKCWNCSRMNCSAMHSTDCCSATCLIDRYCWNSAQPTSTVKRTESGYSKVADPSSAVVPT